LARRQVSRRREVEFFRGFCKLKRKTRGNGGGRRASTTFSSAGEGKDENSFLRRFWRRTLDFPARFFYNRGTDDAISTAAPSSVAVINGSLRS